MNRRSGYGKLGYGLIGVAKWTTPPSYGSIMGPFLAMQVKRASCNAVRIKKKRAGQKTSTRLND